MLCTCLQTSAILKWDYNKLHVFKSFLLLSPFPKCKRRKKKKKAYILKDNYFKKFCWIRIPHQDKPLNYSETLSETRYKSFLNFKMCHVNSGKM